MVSILKHIKLIRTVFNMLLSTTVGTIPIQEDKMTTKTLHLTNLQVILIKRSN